MEFGLKDLLELLYTAHRRFFSVQVGWQYWYRLDLMNAAGRKWRNQHSPGSVNVLRAESIGDTQNMNELRVNWRVSWQKPSYWRDEQQIEGHGVALRVICGERWWSFSSSDLVLYTNVDFEQKRTFNATRQEKLPESHFIHIEDVVQDVPLIDPSFLLASHDLQLLDSTHHAEREAWRVRAVYRRGKELGRDAMFWGSADAYELLVDKERGILLRYAAIINQQEFAVASVDQIIFDETIPESVFSFTPPANTRIEVVL